MHDNRENLETIVSKLKEQGIDAGEAEKQRIIDAAKKQAEEIIINAEAHKKSIIQEAQAKADQVESNTNTALNQASRDMVEATKVAVLQYLDSVFGGLCENLFSQEQYLQELTKVVVRFIDGNKSVAIPANTLKAMQAYVTKEGIKEDFELKPLPNNDAKIVVKTNESNNVQFVLSHKDVQQAMFSLLNKELVERITQNVEG